MYNPDKGQMLKDQVLFYQSFLFIYLIISSLSVNNMCP